MSHRPITSHPKGGKVKGGGGGRRKIGRGKELRRERERSERGSFISFNGDEV